MINPKVLARIDGHILQIMGSNKKEIAGIGKMLERLRFEGYLRVAKGVTRRIDSAAPMVRLITGSGLISKSKQPDPSAAVRSAIKLFSLPVGIISAHCKIP